MERQLKDIANDLYGILDAQELSLADLAHGINATIKKMKAQHCEQDAISDLEEALNNTYKSICLVMESKSHFEKTIDLLK